MQIHLTFKYQHLALQVSAGLVLALFGQTTSAQTTAPNETESVANPAARVPYVNYRSVFKETSLGIEKTTDDWRKANDEVGKFLRGHVDILKWEEQESAKAMKSAAGKPTTKQPIGTTAPKPEATQPTTAPAHKH